MLGVSQLSVLKNNQLCTHVQNFEKEIKRMNIENDIFEKFLTKNEPVIDWRRILQQIETLKALTSLSKVTSLDPETISVATFSGRGSTLNIVTRRELLHLEVKLILTDTRIVIVIIIDSLLCW